MDPLAITKARSRLLTAKSALGDLPTCRDYNLFAARWYVFLVAFKGVYTLLERGAKTSPQSRQWFGAKIQERRSDPLLQYIYQARDDDEHGLNPVTTRVPSRLSIGGRGPDHTLQFDVTGPEGLGGALEVTGGDGKPVLFEYTPAHAQLIRVRGRDEKNTYEPPEEHLGVKLASNLPAAVGELAAAYLEEMITEAGTLA